jgi:hypothetical protein
MVFEERRQQIIANAAGLKWDLPAHISRDISSSWTRICRPMWVALRQSEMRFRVLNDLTSDWYLEQDGDFRLRKSPDAAAMAPPTFSA